MGYYTYKFISCTLRDDTPIGVLNTIRDLMNDEDNHAGYVSNEVYEVFEDALNGVDHDFIRHKELRHDRYFGWLLFFNGSSKNYYGQFEKFLEWLKPYIAGGLGVDDMYAFTIGEGDNNPTIYKLYEGNQY